jgi:fibronectin type 3 domain-containing protein
MSSVRIRIRGRATLVVLFMVVPLAISLIAGAYVNHPLYRTGAPGDDGTCVDCHDDYDLNSGEGYISLTGLPASGYEPAKEYTLTVTTYHPGMTRFGFEVTVLPENPAHSAGSFSCIDSKWTMISTGGKYIKTSQAGIECVTVGTKSWDIRWNSPSVAMGPVTFYGAGLLADNDNDEGDDYVYTTQETLYPATLVPVSPKGIVVEPGDGVVTLSWFLDVESDPKGGPVSYNIYWSDSLTGGLSLLTTVAEREYVHTGLVNRCTYRYQISAVNSEGEGSLSAVVKACPDLLPNRPRYLSASSVTYDQVTINWNPPTNWGDGGSNSYTVLRGPTPWEMEEIATGVTQTTYTDTERLDPNSTVHYQVKAVNSRGSGGVAISSVYVPANTPSFPLGLNVAVKASLVELYWDPPSDEGGDPVQKYRVYRSSEGNDPVLIKDHLTETTYIDTDVMPDVDYEYTVTALNGAGEGAFSTPVAAYIYPLEGTGETGKVSLSEIPFSGLVAVGAVIIIGAVMVGRLARTSREMERREEE